MEEDGEPEVGRIEHTIGRVIAAMEGVLESRRKSNLLMIACVVAAAGIALGIGVYATGIAAPVGTVQASSQEQS